MEVPYLVTYDADAVLEFEDLKGRQERKATFTAIDKLGHLGPTLPPPHASSLKSSKDEDNSDLMELRPRRGSSQVRPIYARIGESEYVILAFAISADKADMDKAVKNARARLKRYKLDT
jgi:hypothetical protein